MDLHNLKPGDTIQTQGGTTMLILEETEDGKWILVRYLKVPDHRTLDGTRDLCHIDELDGATVVPL